MITSELLATLAKKTKLQAALSGGKIDIRNIAIVAQQFGKNSP